MGRLRRWLTDVGMTGFGAKATPPRATADNGQPVVIT
jgi:hypothetical protein